MTIKEADPGGFLVMSLHVSTLEFTKRTPGSDIIQGYICSPPMRPPGVIHNIQERMGYTGQGMYVIPFKAFF